jgi:cobalt-zinc-cadmium efflux system protein
MHEHIHRPKGMKALGVALGVTLLFCAIEFIGGVLTNSLALQTDAVHMLNDSFALFFAFATAWIVQRPASNRRTYGYYRAEVLAAFLNGVLLWGVVLLIFYEALQRILSPSEVKSLDMLAIAVFGLAANGLSAISLSNSKEESLNVKGAFLHVMADMAGSLGAISAGIVMFFTGWYQADPLISIVIGGLIFYGSWKLIKESLNVLLEGVPSHVDVDLLRQRMIAFKGVKDVHDLHVWCITPTRMCTLSCHIVVENGTDRRSLMTDLIEMLREEFRVDHTTIQLEDEGYPKAISEH